MSIAHLFKGVDCRVSVELMKNSVPQPRRRPKQPRSRKRVEAILEAARNLIGEHGADSVSVREIAAQAGVPISSVYQYFPNKSAIVAQLLAEYVAHYQARLHETFAAVRVPNDLVPAVHQAVDAYLSLFVEHPPWPNIWLAVRADPALRELDLAQATTDARLVAALMQQLLPEADPKEVEEVAAFAILLVGSSVPYIHTMPTEISEGLLRELKRHLTLRIESLIQP